MSDEDGTRARILIVEDEGIVALDIEKTLHDLGFEVTGKAASADEAVRSAAANRPDLVLMDVRIRGELDGIETAALLRRDYDVPVAFLTAHGDAETIERAKRTSPSGFLLKPFKQAELYSVIEIALYRARMERLLREREQLLSTTLRSIGDAVVTTDAGLGVTFMNQAAESLTGWSLGDAIGRPLEQVLPLRHEQSNADLTPAFTEALFSRTKQLIAAATLESKDGSLHHVQDSVAPILDGTALHGTVVVITDVTAERHLARQLEFTERLALLGTLAAGVGHEINNPLAFVTANLHFACDRLAKLRAAGESSAGLDELERVLSEARVGADRIAQIVGRLRLFARHDVASGPVDMAAVLTWAINVTEHAWRQRARMVRAIGPLPLVEGDEGRLGQVFVNLITNAAQAIPPGSPDAHEIRVEARVTEGGGVEAIVADTGVGIAPDMLGRIFEPFFTTQPAGQGTGLGLSIVNGIVRDLGGQLTLMSEPGRGSEFRVILPPASARTEPSPADAPVPAPAPAAAPPVARGRVLVIDDEPLVVQAITRVLATLHEVTAVQSGRAAVELLAGGAAFDVVLCDLMMPGMGGAEVYEWIESERPDLLSRFVFHAQSIEHDDFYTGVDSVVRAVLQAPS
ncbi:MAG TPA: response regulator, partial [Nannocystaceae bacterium]|nr:response regulator [Nannocystaceae bacterium]